MKREISKTGLSEREAQELIEQFRRQNADSRRGVKIDTRSGRSGGEIRGIFETETNDGRAEKSNGINRFLTSF